MKESAQAALSYVRSKAKNLGISEDFFRDRDLHIHVPAGAIPKDGPSAGVTILTALASLLTCRPIKSDVAMTGEVTLRGAVLPVGGIGPRTLSPSATTNLNRPPAVMPMQRAPSSQAGEPSIAFVDVSEWLPPSPNGFDALAMPKSSTLTSCDPSER